ncbi:hypothetical protein POSPLADRAFT_1148484 [Postia placenta MAD-698-R-SB12]|uniref:EKC/KEOPS complex subunit CGI121 n=1 Tax=Postia placenta MAD-698-R-SB12 TaxID=670580 RepID=A0A1X6MWX9_9APHY|nr:hypothetical protein POSPLADRAFT_1148484 [Postia placenta MAD-698-R-SB12]OSX60740.1 hypothetical protein POSPLADRAFT_1148484 [Postia placenta MAD-698-R-SB12]
MQTFRYDHFPLDVSCVHVGLFTNVTNAAQLRARLIQASLIQGEAGDVEREAVNFAFVEARLISSILHLQTAVVHAILAQAQGSLRTKTVHSEILWALSPNNNASITEAIRRFGISDETTALLAIRISSPDLTDVEGRMRAVVSGDLSNLNELRQVTDWTNIRKYYKLNQDPALKTPGLEEARQHVIADEIVVSTVAMKSVLA